MILQIKLLSDLCASSGETYNSYVDTDVVYDDYGLPYIPAKRIKGCIREAALELVEWGLFEKSLYENLFGKEGREKSLFALDNAYLQDYEKLVADLNVCKDSALIHPQRVLGLYTYTRTQTAMTQAGVADKGSLRTTRVVNKGMTFEAVIQENVKLTEKQRELLEKAVSMVKHMGTGRTRGLGLVDCSLLEEMEKAVKETATYTFGDRNKLYYTITLKSPLLCKSATGSQEKTHDYIEGSKVLGILAQNLSKEAFAKLMHYDGQGDSIIVSNAYICEAGERYAPVRASLQKKKEQSYDEAGEMVVADMLVPCSEDVQWTPIGHSYVNKRGCIKSVDIETNYHHRRPNDKSVGKATGKDDSAFYQMESIHKGQQFAGYILADREQAMVIASVFAGLDGLRMGYGRNAEYGNVEAAITGVEAIAEHASQITDSFVVKLNAAAILYNENGMPSADVECLKGYLAEKLQIEAPSLKISSAFLNYETIGGFNVTWHRRKPVFTALGMGTVCYIKADKEIDIAALADCFIGERVAEGYGELEVSLKPQAQVTLRKSVEQKRDTNKQEQTGILEQLRMVRSREELSRAGVQSANEMLEKEKSLFAKREFKAALGKISIIVKNEYTLEQIKEQVLGIESKSKRETCERLLNKVESGLEHLRTPLDSDAAARVYLYSFLNQIKYVTYQKGEFDNE